MKDRIRQLMEDQHLTQQNFAQMIGISTATLSNIFNGKTNPSLSIVDGIHKSFPQVNVYWVLYGTPPMYQNQASQGGSEEGAADMHQGITDGAAGGAEGMKQGESAFWSRLCRAYARFWSRRSHSLPYFSLAL